MAKQLYISEFFADTYSGGNTIPWDSAANYFRNAHFGAFWGGGDGLLENLIGFEKFYDKTIAAIYRDQETGEGVYECEDDFYSDYCWEICAFNSLCEGFGKLFAPAKVA
jgi:hypothetical protein